MLCSPSEAHSTIYEFSDAELRAAVEEARSRGTYVMAHVYTDEGIRRCLKAGVRSIEHANFASEETIAMMPHQPLIWTRPLFLSCNASKAPPRPSCRNSSSIILRKRFLEGNKYINGRSDTAYPLLSAQICGELTRGAPNCENSKSEWGSILAVDIVSSATTVNAGLLMQRGKLGVITPGCLC